MNEEDKKVEDIVNESLNDVAKDVESISEVENIKFEDIKARLEKEAKEIEAVKNLDISIDMDNKQVEIDAVNENNDLTPEEKEAEIAKIEEYYERSQRLVGGNQIDNIKDLLEKSKRLMDEKREEIDYEINSLDLSNDFEEKINLYNENVAAISEFANSTGIAELNYKTYDLDVNIIKEDAIKFNEFYSTLNKTGITFENLEEKIDLVNELLDRHPNNAKLIDSADSLAVYASNILDVKRVELENMQVSINLTKEEARIYDSCKSDEEFINMMLENDSEAQRINSEIEIVDAEIDQIRENMKELDENSEEYEKLEAELDGKLDVKVELKNNLSDIKDKYTARKKQLDEYEAKVGQDIEMYNRLIGKVKDLKSRSKVMLQEYTYNQNRKKEEQEKDIDMEQSEQEQQLENDENNVVDDNAEEKDSKSDEEKNKNDEDTKTKSENDTQADTAANGQTAEEKDSKSYEKEKNTKSKGGKSNSSNAQSNDSNSENKELKKVTEPQNARKIIDEFFKLTQGEKVAFLSNEDGYSKLGDAISVLGNNNEGLSLSRKERKNILDIINSDMKITLKEEELNQNKDDMVDLFTKLNNGNKDESLALYNELFTYNKATKLPFISAGLIDKNDQRKLASILNEYTMLLKDGDLTEEEISNFEKFIVNPLNALAIKQDIADMGFFGKMMNKFNGNKLKSFHSINSALKDLKEMKDDMKSGRAYENRVDSLSNSVYSDEELAKLVDELDAKSETMQKIKEEQKNEEPEV